MPTLPNQLVRVEKTGNEINLSGCHKRDLKYIRGNTGETPRGISKDNSDLMVKQEYKLFSSY